MREIIYAGLQKTADALWRAARAIDGFFPERTFQPKWAPAPLLKQRERSFPNARLPAGDRLAVSALRHGSAHADPLRRSRLEGPHRRQPGRDPRPDRRGGRADPDEEGLPEARPLRGRHVDRSGVLQAPGVPLSGARLRHPQGRPSRARDLLDQVRPRGGPDDRPHEPLQHDVQSLLHGREPGRLRPRARVGGSPEAPRRRGVHQAAPAALGPVLGRRADAFAALSSGHPLRPQDRLLLRPVRDQRHPLRAGRELRPRGGRGRSALCVPSVRRRRQRAQPAPQGRQPLRRQAARHREPPQARRGHHPGDDDHQRHQQRPGRRHPEVRHRRTSTRSTRLPSSRSPSPAATRTSTTRPARSSATRSRTWRTTRRRRPASANRCATGTRSPPRVPSPT